MNEKENLARDLFNQEMMRVSPDEIREMANTLHMLFVAFVDAGFTRAEAMTILLAQIRGVGK